MGEFDKKINIYIITHNKNLISILSIVNLKIEFDNNFTATIKANYHYNTDTKNKNSYLLYYIDSCESGRYKFSNIEQLVTKTISDRCKMTYEYFINQPMQAIELKFYMIIAKNPELINS